MKSKLALAAALLVAGVASASAQSLTFRIGPQPSFGVWNPGAYPYARDRHDVCQRKAWRLREFDRHAAADGRISRSERREHDELRADLDRSCGRYRWRG